MICIYKHVCVLVYVWVRACVSEGQRTLGVDDPSSYPHRMLNAVSSNRRLDRVFISLVFEFGRVNADDAKAARWREL